MYGGRNLHVTNVVFVHGSFDPWHAMGVTKDLSPDATAILIPETAHCANMYPEKDDDPPQLKQARVTVGEKIKQWLSQVTSVRSQGQLVPVDPDTGDSFNLFGNFRKFFKGIKD